MIPTRFKPAPVQPHLGPCTARQLPEWPACRSASQ